jgi:hypothetical protein
MATEIDAIIREQAIDFIDLGCSKGGSLKWAMEHLGGRHGLGIDKSAKKVALAKERGMTAIVADATAIACADRAVRFTTMLHFLEHLPSAAIAGKVIDEACRISRDFVYMRHPWFGSDNELFRHGYKFFWSDWSGHPNRFGPLDFHKAIREAPNVRRWWIFGRTPIVDVRHPAIVRLDAPLNSFAAKPAEYESRPPIRLVEPIFCETACLIEIGDAQSALAALADHQLLMSSEGLPLSAQRPTSRRSTLKTLRAAIVRAARPGPKRS